MSDRDDRRARTYRTGSYACPACGALLDSFTRLAGRAGGPRPGTYSICVECLARLVFVAGRPVRLRRLTEAERFALIMDDPGTAATLDRARLAVLLGKLKGGGG